MQSGIPRLQNAMSPDGNLKVTQVVFWMLGVLDIPAGHVKVAEVFTGYPPSTAGQS